MRTMADAADGSPGFSSGSANGGDPPAPLVPDVADTLQGVDTVVRDRPPGGRSRRPSGTATAPR